MGPRTYGKPRMTEALKEVWLDVGHPLPGSSLHADREKRRVGRFRQKNCPPDCLLIRLTA
jgi:hypothetical protein